MKLIQVKITDPAGMHARPASVLSKAAGKYKSDINIRCGEKEANMKSIMGILAMGILAENDIVITINGEDEAAAHGEIECIIRENKIAG